MALNKQGFLCCFMSALPASRVKRSWGKAPQRTPRQRVSLVSPHHGSIGKVVPEPLLVELARSFSLQSVPPQKAFSWQSEAEGVRLKKVSPSPRPDPGVKLFLNGRWRRRFSLRGVSPTRRSVGKAKLARRSSGKGSSHHAPTIHRQSSPSQPRTLELELER